MFWFLAKMSDNCWWTKILLYGRYGRLVGQKENMSCMDNNGNDATKDEEEGRIMSDDKVMRKEERR